MTSTVPAFVPAYSLTRPGARARPLGLSGSLIVFRNRGCAPDTSNTSTPLSVRSAAYTRCAAWSISRSSKSEALPARLGTRAWVVWTWLPPQAATSRRKAIASTRTIPAAAMSGNAPGRAATSAGGDPRADLEVEHPPGGGVDRGRKGRIGGGPLGDGAE